MSKIIVKNSSSVKSDRSRNIVPDLISQNSNARYIERLAEISGEAGGLAWSSWVRLSDPKKSQAPGREDADFSSPRSLHFLRLQERRAPALANLFGSTSSVCASRLPFRISYNCSRSLKYSFVPACTCSTWPHSVRRPRFQTRTINVASVAERPVLGIGL